MNTTDPGAENSAAKSRVDTSLVRSFAIVAIVNSHMEYYYPLPEVAIGGLVGLALFFMATGMGMNASRNTRQLGFFKWYGLRILRIHPSVIACALIIQIAIFGEWRHWHFGIPVTGSFWNALAAIFRNDYVDNLVYPLSTYHFLNKILVFYVPLYFYVRWGGNYKHVVGIGGGVVLCGVTAIPDIRLQLATDSPLRSGDLNEPFLWSIFFLMTLLGVWASDNPWLFRKRSNALTFTCVIVLAVLYLGTKFAMAKLGIFTEGFLLLYLFGILLSLALVVALADEALLSRIKKSGAAVRWCTIGLGTISLEIYLVHTQMYMHRVGREFAFPLSFFCFCVASVAGSLVVHWIANRIRERLQLLFAEGP
ncbi:MAG: acyltransferase [Planctomycetales bacterium]|nr:acyltransferase [Planctomycetales bacterium]